MKTQDLRRGRIGCQLVRGPQKSEAGLIMLLVILLVIMFTGLGLLAMRHTRGELRSAGAYMDSTQAAAAAETAILMVATDMRRNWRYTNSNATCPNYYQKFTAEYNAHTPMNDPLDVGLSDVFNRDGDCTHAGTIPVRGMRSPISTNDPLAFTAHNQGDDADTVPSVGPLAASYAPVTVSQIQPRVAPPPPGYSSDEEGKTYNWYYFNITAQAQYGSAIQSRSTVLGNAVVRATMKIGPVDSVGGDASSGGS